MSKSRQWLGTLNNPDTSMAESYVSLWFSKGGARYVNGQLEKGLEGTVHVQFYLNFAEPVRLAALKKHCPRAHFQVVGKDNGASSYCLKEQTRIEGPWEHGIKPAQRNVKGDVAARNKQILDIGVEQCVEQGLIHMKEYLKLKQCVQAYTLNTTL